MIVAQIENSVACKTQIGTLLRQFWIIANFARQEPFERSVIKALTDFVLYKQMASRSGCMAVFLWMIMLTFFIYNRDWLLIQGFDVVNKVPYISVSQH